MRALKLTTSRTSTLHLRLQQTLTTGLLLYIFTVRSAFALDAAAEYRQLAGALKVRELSTVMFAVYNDENLEQLNSFLKRHPDAPEREKVLYLRAYSIWSLHRYDQAPQAFAQLLKEFPDSKFRRIARIREAAAYLFSGQAGKALPRLQSLHKDYPDRPELYARELAYSLSRCGKQAEALEFMETIETTMIEMGKDRLLPRIATHFDKIRLIGKPLPAFRVRDHRTGRVISPDTLKNRIVLIDFWATWCGPCVAEIPAIQKAQKAISSKDFIVFGICLDEDRKKMDDMIADRQLDWLQYFDGQRFSNQLAVTFDVHSIPVNLLVDRQGVVRAVNLRGKELLTTVRTLNGDAPEKSGDAR